VADIRVSPEQLRGAAGALESHQQEAIAALGNAVTLVHNLQGEWAGLAQIDYLQLFDTEVTPMRQRVEEVLGGMASELRRIALVFEETDQQVI
jgi:WXG100 family type VII secretion target